MKQKHIYITVILFSLIIVSSAILGQNPSAETAKDTLISRWKSLFPNDQIISITKGKKNKGKPWIISYYSRKKNKTFYIKYYPFVITFSRNNKKIKGSVEISFINKNNQWKYRHIRGNKNLFKNAFKKPDKGDDIKTGKPVSDKILKDLFMKLIRKEPGEFITHGPEYPVNIIKTAFHLDKKASNYEKKIFIYRVYFRLIDKTEQKYYCKNYILKVKETEDSYEGSLTKQLTGGCEKY